jgi:asparagine synthase (glutamine-hydrolysing)
MCGIALLFSPKFVREEQKQRMQHSLDAMRHRGPDDEGIWQGKDITIGHRRLSIIDLAASRQPMVDPTMRYILTYNGEIYNYKEIRAGLEGKWQFKTQGDTEILLAGLILRGETFLEKMEGMWAFALWDNLEKKLLICRDRMGKKPLYYQEDQDSFICASELPALACLKNCSWEENLDSSADYLRHGYYLPGTTAYKNVKEILPGQYMTWSPGTTSIQNSYWTLSLERYSGNREQASLDLEQYMIEAVE